MFDQEGKEQKGWVKAHRWMVDKLTDVEGALIPVAPDNMQKWPKAEKDYQIFLENASRLMIRFKKPEHLNNLN